MVIRHIIAFAAVALVGLYAAGLRGQRSHAGEIPDLDRLPRQLSDWYGEDIPTSEGAARVLAADAMLQRLYRRTDGAQAWLFLAYFAQQQVNSQIHSPRHCIPGGGWRVAFIRQEEIDVAGDRRPATRMRVMNDQGAQDVLYWFSTRGGITSGEFALKWDLVKNSLAGRPTDALFVRYNAAVADSAALAEMMGLLEGPLDRLMAEVGLP